MKKMLMIACILCADFIWQTDTTAQIRQKDYRTYIGIGVSSFIDGSCILTAEHGFSDRWSLSITAGFNISSAFITPDRESAEHHQTFNEGHLSQVSSGFMHHESFSIAFWPHGVFNGISLGLGAQQLSTEGIDAILAINYHMHIYERLAVCISGNIRSISLIQNKVEDAVDAGIKLVYGF